jgi:uncharacterized protein YjbI with pentapeptide repeats
MSWRFDCRMDVFWVAPGGWGGADLRDADLGDTCLADASLRRADLRGADLSHADLTHAGVSGVRCDGQTRWPEGFDPSRHEAILVR